MNPDRQGSPKKTGKWKSRTRVDHSQGTQIGDDGTQINHFHDDKSGKMAVILAVVVILAVGSVGVALWTHRGDGSSAAAKVETPQPDPDGTPPPTTMVTTVTGTTVTTTTPAPKAPIWYDLTRLRSVVWNNGFDPIDPVRIGAASFPAGIIGSYQSSTTDQNDKAVWAIGGQCSTFAASVGKYTDSSGGGTGRFVVIGDDRELTSVEVGPNDPAVDLNVDITGVIRLTLLDTKHLQDASNAWGRPRVLCAGSPGPAR